MLDLLTAQCDRHSENVFITEDGSLTFIDNDRALGVVTRCGGDSMLLPGNRWAGSVGVDRARDMAAKGVEREPYVTLCSTDPAGRDTYLQGCCVRWAKPACPTYGHHRPTPGPRLPPTIPGTTPSCARATGAPR